MGSARVLIWLRGIPGVKSLEALETRIEQKDKARRKSSIIISEADYGDRCEIRTVVDNILNPKGIQAGANAT